MELQIGGYTILTGRSNHEQTIKVVVGPSGGSGILSLSSLPFFKEQGY